MQVRSQKYISRLTSEKESQRQEATRLEVCIFNTIYHTHHLPNTNIPFTINENENESTNVEFFWSVDQNIYPTRLLCQ